MNTIRDNKKTIGAKVSVGLYQMGEDIAHKTDTTVSHIVRDAFKVYLSKNHENLQNYPESTQKVIKNMDRYRQAESEALYREHENKVIREAINRETYAEFMDRFLNQLCYGHEGELTDDELNEYLRENMEVLKDRAEHHDKLDQYEKRYRNPYEYVKHYRENKNLLED